MSMVAIIFCCLQCSSMTIYPNMLSSRLICMRVVHAHMKSRPYKQLEHCHEEDCLQQPGTD